MNGLKFYLAILRELEQEMAKFKLTNNEIFDPTAEYPSNFEIYESSQSNPNLSKNRHVSYQWINGDTEEQYIKSTKMGVVHTYKADDVYYNMNKHGFRCDNFNTMKFGIKSVIYLGCSHTFGTGLPEEDCWTYKVHKRIEEVDNTTYNYINFGSVGCGIDYYMHLMPYFKKLNPSYVISLTPEITRMIMPLKDGHLSKMSPWMVDDTSMLRDFPNNRVKDAYEKLLMAGEDFFEYRKQVIYNNINSLGEILNYKFIEMSPVIADNKSLNQENQILLNDSQHENARDNAHYNRTYHTVLANKIMDKLTENK